jgi:hypothetical protein
MLSKAYMKKPVITQVYRHDNQINIPLTIKVSNVAIAGKVNLSQLKSEVNNISPLVLELEVSLIIDFSIDKVGHALFELDPSDIFLTTTKSYLCLVHNGGDGPLYVRARHKTNTSMSEWSATYTHTENN